MRDPRIERVRLIGEPMRIRVLLRPRADLDRVGELTEALGATRQNVSKHLTILIVTLRQTVSGALQGHADEPGLLLEHPTGPSRRVR